ncbi:MAG TPA: hypothetical protein VFR94_11480 [Nitrososphaeraceae archaeon]|nr:hypothetical protein [Nitrososphaeraceae archaeon]
MNNKTTTKWANKIGKQQTGTYLMHSSKYMTTLSAGILAAIFSIGAIDSFAQSESITSIQDQGSNATSATTASLGEPLFVEQGRITGQRVLTVVPQPQLETSFMANTSINNGTGSAVNAVNIGTTTITLNADGTFRGAGQGVLRTKGGTFANWISQTVGNLAPEGNILVRGVTFWSTPPSATGELSFMNGVIGLFEMEIDIQGNLSVTEWQWEGEFGDVAATSPPILQNESPINTTATRTSSGSSPTVMQ